MENYIHQINRIINTLQSLSITSNYDTMNKLLGCIQALDKMAFDMKQTDGEDADPCETELHVSVEEIN